MRARSLALFGLLAASAGGSLVVSGQQPPAPQGGIGQTPSSLPLTQPVRERGSSVTPAYEGWYYDKDGSVRLLVGYFNRNLKQEFDIPAGPNNRIEPGGPDMGQPTHFGPGRGWGVFSIPVPKDFGDKKLTWTIVANGFTNAITLHTKADYVVEPFEDAASKNTPPKLRFKENGQPVAGAPKGVAENYSATAGTPLAITVWASDEGAKLNVPEPRGRARGGDAAAGRGDAAGRGGRAGGRSDKVEVDNVPNRPAGSVSGKATVNVTFATPGEYMLRVEANDSTGAGGGGFQCCWTNAHVGVTVK
ncbi:MAG: hypothetical protein JF601_11060 [Acidobacteria bacterium]|nr:hypothetical protein [Acidobacteriota bacterium]